MLEFQVIAGLKNKRARIAKGIINVQRAIDQRRGKLAMPDAVIGMFTPGSNADMIPAIRPGSHGLFLGYREPTRLWAAHLREAKGPTRLDQVVEPR
jgi:hypothetical protein